MNNDQLREKLATLFDEIRAKKVAPDVAHQMNMTATNIQACVRLELLNARMRNEQPDIDFFKKSKKK